MSGLGAREDQNQFGVQSVAELEPEISHLSPKTRASCKYTIDCVTAAPPVMSANGELWHSCEKLIEQIALMEILISKQEEHIGVLQLEVLRQEEFKRDRLDTLERLVHYVTLQLAMQEPEQNDGVTPKARRRPAAPSPESPILSASLSGATLRGSSSQNLLFWSPPL